MSSSAVTSVRPSWVPATFAGGCKVWPTEIKLLLPYQSAWVRDGARMKIVEKARQVGISLATAYSIVTRSSLTVAKYDDWISSRDDDQASLLIRDCRKIATVLTPGAAARGMQIISEDDQGGSRNIKWASGRATHSLTSNVDAQAGKAGRRVLDEFALHRENRRLYAIAQPGTAWGGSMEIISTHRDTGNYFAALIEEARHGGNPKGFSLHRITLQDALAQGLLYKLQSRMDTGDRRLAMDEGEYETSVRSECPDEASWLEEYCCQPADDEASFIDYELISGCEYEENAQWEMTLQQMRDCEDDLFMGVDIGRRGDLTVMWVLKRVGGILFSVHVVVLKNTPFDSQERCFNDLMQLPHMRRACVDETGMGMQFAESGARIYGHKVEPVTFTNQSKEWLAYPLRTRFERRSLKIPNCLSVRADIHSVRKEYTGHGAIRFAGDRGANGHADRFWALALAVNAADTSVEVGEIVPDMGSRRMAVAVGRGDRSVA